MRFGHNSTIAKKEKICSVCGKPCYWFSKKRCQQCATRQGVEKRMEQFTETELEQDGLQELIKEADTVVSLFVRLSNADKSGNVKCYTCPIILPYQQMQAGHYIGRSHLLLRFDTDRNLRPQCNTCNCIKHGNLAIYSQNLEKEKPGLCDWLAEESSIVYKITRDEVRAIISEYTEKVKSLKQKLK